MLSLSGVFFHFFFVEKPSISWFVLLIFFVFSPQNVYKPSPLVSFVGLSEHYFLRQNIRSATVILMGQENSSWRPLFFASKILGSATALFFFLAGKLRRDRFLSIKIGSATYFLKKFSGKIPSLRRVLIGIMEFNFSSKNEKKTIKKT